MLHLINLGTTFIGDVFNYLFSWFFSLLGNMLPSAPPSSINFLSSFQLIVEFGKQFGFVIPWSTLFICLSIYFGADLVIMLIKFIMWIARLARG